MEPQDPIPTDEQKQPTSNKGTANEDATPHTEEGVERDEAHIDEILKQSFPASDPPPWPSSQNGE